MTAIPLLHHTTPHRSHVCATTLRFTLMHSRVTHAGAVMCRMVSRRYGCLPLTVDSGGPSEWVAQHTGWDNVVTHDFSGPNPTSDQGGVYHDQDGWGCERMKPHRVAMAVTNQRNQTRRVYPDRLRTARSKPAKRKPWGCSSEMMQGIAASGLCGGTAAVGVLLVLLCAAC